jgi:CubicO group peptidase (beta-lactamase class C family)
VSDTRKGMVHAVDPVVLADTLQVLTGKHQVPGAQLAVHEGGRTVSVEIGELEFGTGHQVSPASAFPIGSVSKSFTATVAMVLAADGDLELDAPVGDYLPELRDLGDQVCVGRLLSHTSGLAADPDSDEAATSRLRYVLDYCRPRLLIQPPGVGFSYSNLGYVLTGQLIETITGMSWWEAMESILLRPLGIEPAFLGSAAPPTRPLATGHSVNLALGRSRPVQQRLSRAEAPAGGLLVSASDLVALALLHVWPGEPGLLPAPAAARMRQVAPAANPFGLADGWASGLALFRHDGTDWFGHDGNGIGTSCHFRVDPVAGRVVALTCNASTGYGLWQDVLDALGRTGMPIGRHQPHASDRAVPAPPGCLGSYRNGGLEYVVTSTGDGLLRFSVEGDVFDKIVCHDDLTFSVPDPTSIFQVFTGRFLPDRATGEIDGIQTGGRLARRYPDPARAAIAG